MIQPPEDECANMLPHVQQLYLFNNSVCDCFLNTSSSALFLNIELVRLHLYCLFNKLGVTYENLCNVFSLDFLNHDIYM